MYASPSFALKRLAQSSPMVKAMIDNAPSNQTSTPNGQVGITSTGRLVTKVNLTAGQMVGTPSGMIHRFGSKGRGEENHKYIVCNISPIKEDLRIWTLFLLSVYFLFSFRGRFLKVVFLLQNIKFNTFKCKRRWQQNSC